MGVLALALALGLTLLLLSVSFGNGESVSAIGDPGMRRDSLRVAFESWNFCNEVGHEAPAMGSPRAADCFDLLPCKPLASSSCIQHKVGDNQNRLGVGNPFPGLKAEALMNPDLYAVHKELYLGSLCQVQDAPTPWSFWMVMLKNGNFDTTAALCPRNGQKIGPFTDHARFPCPAPGCMNHPSLNHHPTSLSDNDTFLRGGFRGSYELDFDIRRGIQNISYYEVTWEKQVGPGSWKFRHKLKTSRKYPWLMLYLRADATLGFSGGYHYDTRGMLKTVSLLNIDLLLLL
ncbi:hypothetical protein RND81_13G220000 [Saponaria officinalis]|uniref:DUF7705 domain-containing protein n=1 Tax=Saponaria officinalis TaxID=3572 RepID=A0AAW1H527_SAPOF